MTIISSNDFKSQQLFQSLGKNDKSFTSTNENDCHRVIEANREREKEEFTLLNVDTLTYKFGKRKQIMVKDFLRAFLLVFIALLVELHSHAI